MRREAPNALDIQKNQTKRNLFILLFPNKNIKLSRELKGGKKKMAKLTALLVTLIGLVLVLAQLGVSLGAFLDAWLIPVTVLVIGLGKVSRNYKLGK